MKPLNVQKLRELCEAVVRDCKGAESKIYKAADESYMFFYLTFSCVLLAWGSYEK